MIDPIPNSHLLGCERQDAAELPPSCPSVYPVKALMGCSWLLFGTQLLPLPHKHPRGSSTRAKTLLKPGVERAEARSRAITNQFFRQLKHRNPPHPFLLLPKQLLCCL